MPMRTVGSNTLRGGQTVARRPNCAPSNTPKFTSVEAEKPEFAGPLEARLHAIIVEHCARRTLGLRAFGATVTGDAEFVPSLARGRSPTLRTVDAVLAGMDMPPAGPVFEAEVDAFLAVTGTRVSVLGRSATHNPSFVAHLKDGASPELRTVHKVRSWMAANTSPTPAREIRRRTGPMPEPLSDVPRRRRFSRQHAPIAITGGGQSTGDGDGPFFMDTKEAAALVGLAAATLERYRSVGGGPVYYRLPERIVRYRREDLAKWQAGRRRT